MDSELRIELGLCPRCEEEGLERLRTYNHCVSCFYFEDHCFSPEMTLFEMRKTEVVLSPPVDSRVVDQKAAS